MRFLRSVAARLPNHWQTELKRIHFRRRIRQGSFVSDEPEFAFLPKLVVPGDWVIDIGANVGFYTKRLAELVGPSGRVLAFEPIPETFALLASNAECCRLRNITLFNLAVSSATGVTWMSIPTYPQSAQRNFYQAHVSHYSKDALEILKLTLDSLDIPKRVKLIKIDAEGHELSVIRGMQKTLERYRPILIVEVSSQEVWTELMSLDYVGTRLHGSPNVLFHPSELI